MIDRDRIGWFVIWHGFIISKDKIFSYFFLEFTYVHSLIDI